MLRILAASTRPPGHVRLAGEIDYQQRSVALALTRAIRFDGDITVNMTAMTFIDGFGAGDRGTAARGMARRPGTVALNCHPDEATFVCSAPGRPGGAVSLVRGHDR